MSARVSSVPAPPVSSPLIDSGFGLLLELYRQLLQTTTEKDFKENLQAIRNFQAAVYVSYFPFLSYSPLLNKVLVYEAGRKSLTTDVGRWEALHELVRSLLSKAPASFPSVIDDLQMIDQYLDFIRPNEHRAEHKAEHKTKEEKEFVTKKSLLAAIAPGRIIAKCKSDGNCGFQGVSMFLGDLNNAHKLREWLYEQLSNEEVAKKVNSVVRATEKQWLLLLERIEAKTGVMWRENWMNDEAMRALSYLLDRNIYVIDTGRLSVFLYPRGYGDGKFLIKIEPPESAKINDEDIVLLLSENHYDTLLPFTH